MVNVASLVEQGLKVSEAEPLAATDFYLIMLVLVYLQLSPEALLISGGNLEDPPQALVAWIV